MRGRRLTILAAISLTCLPVLLFGHFVTVGAVAERYTPRNAQFTTHHLRVAGLDRGRCCIAFENIPSNVGWPKTPNNFDVSYVLRFGWPQAGPSLWQFALRRVTAGGFLLAFPIWCLAVPCAIAPILWWRRRRRRTARGFPVEVQAAGR